MKRSSFVRIGLAVCISGSVVGILAAVCGCGRSGPERAVVSGKVTFRGKPLKQGQIRFIPLKDSDAPVSGAIILDGQYTADGNGGVPVGTHKVEIIGGLRTGLSDRAARGGDAQSDRKAKESHVKTPIPAKYNRQSTLELTVKPGSGSLVHDFTLTD